MEIGIFGLTTTLAAAGAVGALLGRLRVPAPKAVAPGPDLEACTGFDLSLPYMRFRKTTGLDQATARRVEREFRRYFALIAMSPDCGLGMKSSLVDAFWHEVILCTSLYREFCTAAVGRFVDHDPMAGDVDAYARTWGAYVHIFEEEPDPDLWPAPDPEALGRLRIRTSTAGPAGKRFTIMLVVSVDASDGGSDGSGGDGGGDGCGSE